MTFRSKLSTCLISLGVLLIGIVVIVGATTLPATFGGFLSSSKAFPYAVGAMLMVIGLILARSALTARWKCEATDPDEPAPDFPAILWVCGGGLVNLLLIQTIGFILSSTIMYVMVARGFGARNFLFSAILGFCLALVAYYGFAQLLGLRMGDGLIEDLL